VRRRLLVILICASLPAIAHAQTTPPQATPAQTTPASPYPVRVLDRPTTLPRGDSRLDAFVFVTRTPGSPTTTTMVVGGGVGITDQLEIGGQALAFDIAPDTVFTNPSLYATWSHNISKTVAIAPTVQVVYPLESDDPFFVDVGGTLYVNIGSWGYVAFAPILSVNTRADDSGTTISLPVTLMRQSSERLNFQLTSGVGFARFDPRFGVARRRDALDFNEVTVPVSAEVMYTVPHGTADKPLVDVTLQVQWPQLYTRAEGMRGTNADDFSVQVMTSWYFIR
jgi:hypothetical protein